ncbi:MAG: tetratricopeptide repeat protein [Desulfuromusa sp.]|nr:tetratricopeptide repeat protein [Desulfuromusa sp.]
MFSHLLNWSLENVRFIPLLIVLSLLTGCAAGTMVMPETVLETAPALEGPAVTQFEDGRRGFVITEVANLNATARRDFDQAVVWLHEGNYEQAIELLENVVEASPGVSAPYINLALAYRKVNKSELAEENLKTALNLISGHPVASNEYGLLLRKAGRFEEAKTIYEQSLMIFPDYLPVRRNLGIMCDLYMNDQQCALTQYEFYSEANPEDKQAKMWVSELRLRLGQ